MFEQWVRYNQNICDELEDDEEEEHTMRLLATHMMTIEVSHHQNMGARISPVEEQTKTASTRNMPIVCKRTSLITLLFLMLKTFVRCATCADLLTIQVQLLDDEVVVGSIRLIQVLQNLKSSAILCTIPFDVSPFHFE